MPDLFNLQGKTGRPERLLSETVTSFSFTHKPPLKILPPRYSSIIRRIDTELLMWSGALIALGLSDPHRAHFSLCLLKNLGFEHCPGCGLGHSISFLLRGEWAASWQSHPLGGPALLIIGHRIIRLAIQLFSKSKSPDIWIRTPY